MGGIFNINSPVFRVLAKVFDIFALSVIWTLFLVPTLVVLVLVSSTGIPYLLVVCCIPACLIGPATTALYYAVVKSVRKDRSHPTREFFKSFKMNFKQAAIVSSVITLLVMLLIVNLAYSKALGTSFGNFLWYVYAAMCLILAMISMYVFPVLSRFTVTIKNLVKLSLFFSIRHLLTTVVTLVIVAAGAFLSYITLLIALVFVPALCCLLLSFMMEKVLVRYIPDAKKNSEDEGPVDEWYND